MDLYIGYAYVIGKLKLILLQVLIYFNKYLY